MTSKEDDFSALEKAYTDKESEFDYRVKFDAVSLQGIWLNYPGVGGAGGGGGRGNYAAGLYEAWLVEADKRRKEREAQGYTPKETPMQLRHRLLREVENRIALEDNVDEALILVG